MPGPVSDLLRFGLVDGQIQGQLIAVNVTGQNPVGGFEV